MREIGRSCAEEKKQVSADLAEDREADRQTDKDQSMRLHKLPRPGRNLSQRCTLSIGRVGMRGGFVRATVNA